MQICAAGIATCIAQQKKIKMIDWSIVDWHAVGRFMLSIAFFGPVAFCAAVMILEWWDEH